MSNVLKSFEASPDPSSRLSDFNMRSQRKDKLDHTITEAIRKFWHKKSRPTGEKRDIIRKTTGVKCYEKHPRQMSEKTQTELYFDICKEEPTLKCSQASFKKLKPFHVKTATKSDRNTCLCRKHVEIHKVFKDFITSRKKIQKGKYRV